jgi:SAM-dependent methyltransferase
MRRECGSAMRVHETWPSFWGELMLRRFHLDNPQRWSAREAKADWLLAHLAPAPSAPLVDLGCGDGVLDICLARRGYRVTAIDRVATVLEAAREEAAGASVDFVAADLRCHDLGERRFAGAILLDTLGLMARGDELDLFRRVRRALQPGGLLILDWPRAGGSSTWERAFSDGVVKVNAEYDGDSRVQVILLEFHHTDGRVTELNDPLSSGDYTGLRRYLYLLNEAQALLSEAGFASDAIPHYRPGSGYHALLSHLLP